MTCPNCGREAGGDRGTGYNADELCPECASKGYYINNETGVIEFDGDVERVRIYPSWEMIEASRQFPIVDDDGGDDECPF